MQLASVMNKATKRSYSHLNGWVRFYKVIHSLQGTVRNFQKFMGSLKDQ